MSFEKIAYEIGFKLASGTFEKTAGLNSEIVGTAINPLSTPASVIGGLIGYLQGDAQKRKEQIPDEELWMNMLIPGLAGYRIGTRQRAALTKD